MSAMILLIGASASGKTETAKLLRSEYGIAKAITHTSRQPRAGEKNGVDYFFVTKNAFETLLKEDFFVEHTFYNGHYYGCSKAQVNDDKCVVVDPNGLRSFLALHDSSIITFYLKASEETRKNRMRSRGDKDEEIIHRLVNDRKDFAPENIEKTDFVISTDGRTLEQIAKDIYSKYLSMLQKRGFSTVRLTEKKA